MKNKPVPAKPRSRQKREWIEHKDDGREVLNLETRKGQQEYRMRVMRMWHRQNGICQYRGCSYPGRRIAWKDASFDHTTPRGMNGALRDDRIEIRVEHADGSVTVVEQNQCLHLRCNILKGSRREVREDMLLRQTSFEHIDVDSQAVETDTAICGDERCE